MTNLIQSIIGRIAPALACTGSILLAAIGGIATPANAASNGLEPGSIYREYAVQMRQPPNADKDWRVFDPEATCESAKPFLPNSVLHMRVDDLKGAVRAELVVDRWGGHVGTSDKRFRLNGNTWIRLPEVTTTPTGHKPEAYSAHDMPVADVPLGDLHEGDNTLEGTSGPQVAYSFGCGQWGWYGAILRVYYGPDKEHPAGSIIAPARGSTLREDPGIMVDAKDAAGISRVDILGYYDDYDENGDGIYQDWHHRYSSTDIEDHIGTAVKAPYRAIWNTDWIPDQAPRSIKLIARICDKHGMWYVTDIVDNLSLDRPTVSVKLYKPLDVPENYWVRDGATRTSKVVIPDDLSQAIDARMNIRTWNGEYEQVSLNDYRYDIGGNGYLFALTTPSVLPADLKAGDNTITFHSETKEHGVEIDWPGPGLTVRYRKPQVAVRNDVWHEEEQAFRLPVTVSTSRGDYVNKPVEVPVNFTSVFRQKRVKGSFDENSLRMTEVDEHGNVIDNAVAFQFDKSDRYDARKNASGTLIFLANGTTAPGKPRRFDVYFAVPGLKYTPATVPQLVTFRDKVMCEGQESYRIATQNAVYYYHKSGAAFARIDDLNGKDWIGYHQGGGSAGEFRGIPNAGYPDHVFHPGFDTCVSRIVNQGPLKITIASESKDGKWACQWAIYPNCATMTLLRTAHPYWLLYEGTPGGKFEPEKAGMVLSDGTTIAATEKWAKPLPSPKWIYFHTAESKRVLFLARHEDEGVTDSFYPMEGQMTVFGFARNDQEKYGQVLPAHLTIGFSEQTDYQPASKEIAAAYQPLDASIGKLETR